MKKTPDYGKNFALWRSSENDVWVAYTQHDFVEGLRQGTLPTDSFLHYLSQDYIFLKHFSRAWALAVVKAADLVEMRAASTTVHALLHDEMNMHVQTCAKEGINETELSATLEAAENLAYTRYVLEVGYTGDFLDLMAVLAPCVFGYGEIGGRLGKTITDQTYVDWVATYAGEDYQNLCGEVGALIDRAVNLRYGDHIYETPRWKELCNKFRVATELEIGFWDMGLKPS